MLAVLNGLRANPFSRSENTFTSKSDFLTCFAEFRCVFTQIQENFLAGNADASEIW